MSPDKLIYQANQIAKFFHSQPKAEQAEGVATHINKFWEPRMRRQFFAMMDDGAKGFDPIVVAAVPLVRKPFADPDTGAGTGHEADGAPGGEGTAAGEQKSETSIPQ